MNKHTPNSRKITATIGGYACTQKAVAVLEMMHDHRVLWGDMVFVQLHERGLWRTALSMMRKGILIWDKSEGDDGSMRIADYAVLQAVDFYFLQKRGKNIEVERHETIEHGLMTDEEMSRQNDTLNSMEKIAADADCMETYRRLYVNDDFTSMKENVEWTFEGDLNFAHEIRMHILDAAEYLCGLRGERHIEGFTLTMCRFFDDNRNGIDFTVRKFLHPFMEFRRQQIAAIAKQRKEQPF